MADNNKNSNFSSLSQGEGRGEALITGAEALMGSLEHQGVKSIFGYPGGSIMPVFDALYDHRKELNHILLRHEQAWQSCIPSSSTFCATRQMTFTTDGFPFMYFGLIEIIHLGMLLL